MANLTIFRNQEQDNKLTNINSKNMEGESTMNIMANLEKYDIHQKLEIEGILAKWDDMYVMGITGRLPESDRIRLLVDAEHVFDSSTDGYMVKLGRLTRYERACLMEDAKEAFSDNVKDWECENRTKKDEKVKTPYIPKNLKTMEDLQIVGDVVDSRVTPIYFPETADDWNNYWNLVNEAEDGHDAIMSDYYHTQEILSRNPQYEEIVLEPQNTGYDTMEELVNTGMLEVLVKGAIKCVTRFIVPVKDKTGKITSYTYGRGGEVCSDIIFHNYQHQDYMDIYQELAIMVNTWMMCDNWKDYLYIDEMGDVVFGKYWTKGNKRYKSRETTYFTDFVRTIRNYLYSVKHPKVELHAMSVKEQKKWDSANKYWESTIENEKWEECQDMEFDRILQNDKISRFFQYCKNNMDEAKYNQFEQVLVMKATGWKLAEIARILQISVDKVKKYNTVTLKKMVEKYGRAVEYKKYCKNQGTVSYF